MLTCNQLSQLRHKASFPHNLDISGRIWSDGSEVTEVAVAVKMRRYLRRSLWQRAAEPGPDFRVTQICGVDTNTTALLALASLQAWPSVPSGCNDDAQQGWIPGTGEISEVRLNDLHQRLNLD